VVSFRPSQGDQYCVVSDNTCGEDYLETEVLAEVERIAEAAVASGVEVLVRDFPVKC
jgi:hypothetical protein